MQNTDLYRRIRGEIEGISMVDTHEHLISEQTRLSQKIDLFHWFSHYASSDLVSAGMPRDTLERVRCPDLPVDERWAEFAPFWKDIRNTGYGRALLLAAHDLFDVDDISQATYQELSDKLTESNHSGWHYHVLKERARLHLSLVDVLEEFDPTPKSEMDRRLVAPVLRVDEFVTPANRLDLKVLERKTGVSIHSLDDLLNAMELAFDKALHEGAPAVKLAVAYERSLQFEKVAKADAERVFNLLSRYPVSPVDNRPGETMQLPPVSWHEAKPLHDYLTHQAIRRAVDHNLPLQVHTGLQEGNGNMLLNSHPLQLVNLFLEYPEARFDLFHAGYPYQSEMATLGKNFQNVYLDLCWVHIISPWVARQTLHEWLETVPASKIFAFGGDYIFVEGAYAHSSMARGTVAEVLAEKVESGYFTESEVFTLAHMLLRDNAIRFFRLPAA
jgi:hypothetical protein